MPFYADLLLALQTSALGHAMRHSEWLYVVANLLHVLGAALLVGGIAVLDIRLIRGGGRSGYGMALTARTAMPIAAFGLALQFPTGVMLLAPEAVALGQNPAFYAKLAFMALGFLNLAIFHARFGWWPADGMLPHRARHAGLASLAAWVMTLLAGRLIAYL